MSAEQQEMDGRFSAMQKTVLLVKRYGHQLPEATQRLFDSCGSRWNNLRTKVSLAKQRLGPRIQEESENITRVPFTTLHLSIEVKIGLMFFHLQSGSGEVWRACQLDPCGSGGVGGLQS